MDILILAVVFSALAGVLANTRGRSGLGYFILSLLISPLITFVLLLVMKEIEPAAETMTVPMKPGQSISGLDLR